MYVIVCSACVLLVLSKSFNPSMIRFPILSVFLLKSIFVLLYAVSFLFSLVKMLSTQPQMPVVKSTSMERAQLR